ncbi:Voa1 protein [Maudiozyma humilis]|uniref:Voa1 protein n=1 Tax=Maudiozyma humilis TaxID=51915 RepID=A0AAV5RUF0_MAUHU|nr:Voa1 protein [Kazachstania humilis]
MNFLTIVSLFVQLVLAAASTSYVSLGDQDVVDPRVSSAEDIIEKATIERPVVVLQFKKAKVLEAVTESSANLPFLNQFLKHAVTNVITDDVKLSRADHDEDVVVIKAKSLSEDPLKALNKANVENKRSVWFKFSAKEYDVEELDHYLETVVVYLEEYLSTHVDIILNTVDTITLEQFDEETVAQETVVAASAHDEPKSKPSGDSDEDDDALSPIWTEGLLMCLIVAFLLLVILVIALTWMASLDISYGALEKSTNPLKKNQ